MIRNFKMYMLFVIMIVTSPFAVAQSEVTTDSVSAFFGADESFARNRNVDGLLSMYADDYSGVRSNGDIIGKEEMKLQLYNVYMNAIAILRKIEIQSVDISPDKLSADVKLKEDTKFLIERSNKNVVFPELVETKVKLKIVDGKLLYAKREVTKRIN